MEKSNDGAFFLLIQVQTGLDGYIIYPPIIGFHYQRTKGITEVNTLVVVIEYLIQRRKSAVMHVGRGHLDISQCWDFELPFLQTKKPVAQRERERRKTNRQESVQGQKSNAMEHIRR